MRCTVELDNPEALAIERVLQWVAADNERKLVAGLEAQHIAYRLRQYDLRLDP